MFPIKQRLEKAPPLLISRYLNPKLVKMLISNERDTALLELVELLDSQHILKDKKSFYRAILERESIVSTGVGMGVAVPHAKLRGYESFFIAIGLHPKGIPWDSLDGLPVRLVFMIGGPEDRQTEYLQLLSRLTFAIKDEERRKKMLQLQTPVEIISLFKGL